MSSNKHKNQQTQERQNRLPRNGRATVKRTSRKPIKRRKALTENARMRR